MYEVTTATKTIATDISNVAEAMRIAVEAFKTHNYVEVKKVISTSPYYAKSVRIFSK